MSRLERGQGATARCARCCYRAAARPRNIKPNQRYRMSLRLRHKAQDRGRQQERDKHIRLGS